MSKRSNTVPYTNANRAGRTQPGLIEIIEKSDPRHYSRSEQVVPNRADLRRRGIRGGASRRLPGLHARCSKTFRPKVVEA